VTGHDVFLELLRLFPGLGVGLAIGWYGHRLLVRAYDAHVATLKENEAKLVAAKELMIARLEAEIDVLRKERDKWLREALGRGKT
jgi:hypothetical protein